VFPILFVASFIIFMNVFLEGRAIMRRAACSNLLRLLSLSLHASLSTIHAFYSVWRLFAFRFWVGLGRDDEEKRIWLWETRWRCAGAGCVKTVGDGLQPLGVFEIAENCCNSNCWWLKHLEKHTLWYVLYTSVHGLSCIRSCDNLPPIPSSSAFLPLPAQILPPP
jgi:hypothetical protein